MINRIKQLFSKPAAVKIEEPKEKPRGAFSTDENPYADHSARIDEIFNTVLQAGMAPLSAVHAKYAMDTSLPIKSAFYPQDAIPQAQLLWYSTQTFIGWQTCAILAQQWLIAKCCEMPARDAIRKGYEITVNDGTKVTPEKLDAIRKADVRFNINANLLQFIKMGRVFGIRIAMFIVESEDQKDYYEKPFNPDGITPGSYKGISQIDPYWITPELDAEAAGQPGSIHFYEPTWWRVGIQRIHRSHLVIYRTEEVPDILKPTYIYGGVPIPQKICERVYAAEKTANEAPMLALTKRTDVLACDMGQAVANQMKFDQRMSQYIYRRDNFGIKLIGENEKMEQFDTSLADLDAVIMTQYQLVAAAANVPAVKLMGTTPKGFNSTGEYEEASYHEELESIQKHDLTPLLDRHHLCLIRSEISPGAPFEVSVAFNPLDAMTAKEQAEVNKYKAETDAALSGLGAVDGHDVRQRIINDPDSGYNGLDDEIPDEIASDPEGA